MNSQGGARLAGGWSAGSRKHGEYLERTRREEAVTIRPEGEAQAPRKA